MEIFGNLVQLMEAGFTWCRGEDIRKVQDIIATVILIIQVIVPVLLIIFGMLDLGKAVVASKEDEIKKGQQTLLKRLIAAAIVFFVIFLTKVLVGFLAGETTDNKESIVSCITCFTNGTGNEKCINNK